MVYFGASQLGAPTSQAGGYFALHISTHQLAWKQQLDVDPALPIMLVGNTLYLDTSSNLGAYDAQTGKQQWAMNTSFSPVTLANNLIYGIDYSQHLFAVSLDGKPQWQIDPMFGTSMISSLSAQMLYAQGVIYLARYDSTSKHWQIYAISVS